MLFWIFVSALGFDRFRGCTEVALNFSFFLVLRFFAEDILVFGVGLGEVVQAEPLAVLQIAATLGIALDHQFNTPLDFGRRALSAAAEELVVFNFELADVAFELRQFLVDSRHGWKSP